MAKVTLNGLSKQFGDVKAVENLHLEVREGEFVTLLGPSGCGKSTTLFCIAGLEDPTAGEVRFNDRVVNALSPRDRDIAMVFQDYALYPHMSVYDNMAFGLQLRKLPKAEVDQRVRKTAGMLGIEQLLKRRPSQLSGGQRQRVALGRAIVRNPSVFLLDEPLSNLDAKLRVHTRTEIKKLQHDLGVTTVFVTHDQEEAMVLSDRVAVMNQGILQQFDPPQDTYRNPVNRYVASFIGSPTMNFLDGRLEQAEGGLAFAFQNSVVRCDASTVKPDTLRSLSGGRAVVLGVRPESVHVSRNGEGSMPGQVVLVEPVGAITFLDLTVDGLGLKASTDPELDMRDGEQISVRFAPNRVYFFDPKTEERL